MYISIRERAIYNSMPKLATNVFLFNDERHYGIDNIYIGNINTQHKLSKKFFYELDEILKKNKSTINQEFLVYRINIT